MYKSVWKSNSTCTEERMSIGLLQIPFNHYSKGLDPRPARIFCLTGLSGVLQRLR